MARRRFSSRSRPRDTASAGAMPRSSSVLVPAGIVQHDDLRARPSARRGSGSSKVRQRRVDEDHAIVGVIDDVGQLIRGQAQVERVQHRAEAGHARSTAPDGDSCSSTACRRDRRASHPSAPASMRGDAPARENRRRCSDAFRNPSARRFPSWETTGPRAPAGA